LDVLHPYEQLGLFYLGKRYDLAARTRLPEPILYDSRDLVTHAVCVGMTGSGKTGLGITVIEESALDGIPVLAIDPKGDLANLLLTFPSLSTAEFQPWVNISDSAAAGSTPEAFAAREADAWRAGLAEWDQDAERIARLRHSVDMRLYTPGSRAATSLALLRALRPPHGGDEEEVAAHVAATADSLLALAGVDEVSPHGRERVLIAALLQHAGGSGYAVDLPWLVQNIQKPPFDRVGILDLETFYPARERQELALRLNAVLATPGFDVWLSGEPLDAGRMLYTSEGRPRVAIVSIAHLDDRERMLAVSLVLNEVLAWTRRQPGTSSLRALIYMDEVAGYIPPTANPPSKPALLTLMKQARAFGVGVMLSTQNPVDIDYKGLSNAGTWFLGKLQTERDKARVLDGLEGASPASFDRATLDQALSALGKRVFLLHNVHDAQPVVFETRWTLSYLRGPLMKEELRRLSASSEAPRPHLSISSESATTPPPPRPIVPTGVREFFVPGVATTYEPRLYGAAQVAYVDKKRGIDAVVDVSVLVPFGTGAISVNWDDAVDARVRAEALLPSPVSPDAGYRPIPPAALNPRSYPVWEREFERWIARARPLKMFSAPRLKLSSHAGESERDFRIRVRQARHEQRDAAVARLREKYAPRSERLAERVTKAQEAVARERQQAEHQKMQTAVSIGATLLGALVGRKAASASTLGRATTAARGVSRSSKEAQDVQRAETRVADLQKELADLQAALQRDIDAMAVPGDEPLEEVAIKPARGGASVRLVVLAWVPSVT
jgi:hypothetical protein